MALAGAADLSNGADADPADVRFEQALTLREGETRKLQLVVGAEPERAFGFRLFSREQGGDLQSPWTLHARGRLHLREEEDGRRRVEPEEAAERSRASVTGEDFYREMSRRRLVEQLTEALPSERLAIFTARLQAETCSVLGLPASAQLDAGQGFFDLGMNSLMVTELARALEAVVGKPLPLSTVFEHANIDALARYLSEHVLDLRLTDDAPPPAPHGDAAVAAALEQLEQLEQLSDEEALALLTEKFPLE
jgi:hypothetical protein